MLVVCCCGLQQNEDFIQDALRVVAYSMEQQNWGLVDWFLGKHVTQDLGSYFLPVIAQVGTATGPASNTYVDR
jgi:hypothetical protein